MYSEMPFPDELSDSYNMNESESDILPRQWISKYGVDVSITPEKGKFIQTEITDLGLYLDLKP
jgi:hypothetical protein